MCFCFQYFKGTYLYVPHHSVSFSTCSKLKFSTKRSDVKNVTSGETFILEALILMTKQMGSAPYCVPYYTFTVLWNSHIRRTSWCTNQRGKNEEWEKFNHCQLSHNTNVYSIVYHGRYNLLHDLSLLKTINIGGKQTPACTTCKPQALSNTDI